MAIAEHRYFEAETAAGDAASAFARMNAPAASTTARLIAAEAQSRQGRQVEALLRSGRGRQGREALMVLRREADRRGFRWIVSRAAALLDVAGEDAPG